MKSLESHLKTLQNVNSDLADAMKGYEALIEQAKDGRLPAEFDNHQLSIANTSVKLCSTKAADMKAVISAFVNR